MVGPRPEHVEAARKHASGKCRHGYNVRVNCMDCLATLLAETEAAAIRRCAEVARMWTTGDDRRTIVAAIEALLPQEGIAVPLSRSQARRISVQKGQPWPVVEQPNANVVSRSQARRVELRAEAQRLAQESDDCERQAHDPPYLQPSVPADVLERLWVFVDKAERGNYQCPKISDVRAVLDALQAKP